jgi:anti-sigma factor RsiW
MNEHLSNATIIDYIHGELPPAADALALGHVHECASCRAEIERETRLSEALKVEAAQDDRDLPAMVKAQIWQVVRTERPSLSARLVALLRPAVAVPAAAILVAVVYFASPIGRGTHAPATVDATYYLEQHAAEQMQSPFAERGSPAAVLETSDSTADAGSITHTAATTAIDAVQ